MNISIIGATGFVGKALLNEALQRGHQVVAIARNTDSLSKQDNLLAKNADAADQAGMSEAVQGSDVVISAYNAGWSNPNLYQDFIDGSKAVQQAITASGVKRLIVIGGAGSLYVAPGVQLVDTPEFPEEYKAAATAARDYYNVLKQDDQLDWTVFSPAIEMHPGIDTGRTGKYRIALDEPVFDANNRSILSVEDLAVAIMDEAEQNKHIRQRFTAAY